MTDSRSRRMLAACGEGLVLLAGLAVMFFTAHEMSAKKTLWMDELVTYQEATDPSLRNMLSAVRHMDGNPPLYPLLMRAWTGAFGADEFTFRLPTTIGLALAMLACWTMTRRRFGFWPATLASFLVFLTPYDVLYHYSEARYYGLLMFLASLAIVTWERLARVERPGVLTLVANAVVHAALVTTHVFGGLYGACALGTLVVVDLRAGRRRWRVWASFAAGWAAIIPWIPSFLDQRDLGRPHGWITMPSLDRVVDAFNYGLNDSLPVFLLLVAAAVSLRRGGPGTPDNDSVATTARPDHSRTIGLALAFLIVPPLVALAASHLVVTVFLPRYFLPGLTGFLILLAALLERAGLGSVRGTAARVLLFCALVFTLTTPLRMIHSTPPSFVTAIGADLAGLYEDGIPIVTEDPQVYLPFHHYHSREHFWLVVDWPSCLDPEASPTAVNLYKMMTAMKLHYPVHNVIEGDRLLADHDRFYFIETTYYRWSERELRSNPAWSVEHVALNVFEAKRR